MRRNSWGRVRRYCCHVQSVLPCTTCIIVPLLLIARMPPLTSRCKPHHDLMCPPPRRCTTRCTGSPNFHTAAAFIRRLLPFNVTPLARHLELTSSPETLLQHCCLKRLLPTTLHPTHTASQFAVVTADCSPPGQVLSATRCRLTLRPSHHAPRLFFSQRG
jgi:hypothetical protein